MLSIRGIEEGVREAVAPYPVRRVALFGSYADGRQTESSDVDLLVEFTSAAVSLVTVSALRQRLEDCLGAEVDLVHAPVPEGSLLEVGRTLTVYEG